MIRSPRSSRGSGASSSRRLDLDLAERLVGVHTAQGSLVVALFRLDLFEQVFLVPPLGLEHLLMRRFRLQTSPSVGFNRIFLSRIASAQD